LRREERRAVLLRLLLATIHGGPALSSQ
jgi:hypothetical protein